MNIPTHDHARSTSNYNSIYRRSSAIYHTAYSKPIPFSNTSFSVVSPHSIDVEGILPSSFNSPEFPALFQDLCMALSRSLGPNFLGSQVQDKISTSLYRVEDYRSYYVLFPKNMILLPSVRCIHDTEEQVMGNGR